MLNRKQIISNIDAMESQGAKPEEIQGWLDSLKSEQQQPAKKEMGFMEKQFSSEGKSPIQNIALGFGKEIASTAQGISTIGQKTFGKAANVIASKLIGKDIPEQEIIKLPEYSTKQEGTAQNIGGVAGKVAEFAAPSSLFSKATRAWGAGVKTLELAKNLGWGGKLIESGLGLAGKSIAGAGEMGLVQGLRTGEAPTKGDLSLGAIAPVATNILSYGLSKVAKPLQRNLLLREM